MIALATVSAIFLRWLPRHGFPILLLLGVAVAAAAAIYFTQRQRYRSSCNGISRERIDADITAVASTAFAAVTLGALGIGIVLTAD
ncbi:hypothetical protein QFZ33_002437 [Arthrobacter globiformis]|nr:hypothetical protein [Arthrobacter globiformis]